MNMMICATTILVFRIALAADLNPSDLMQKNYEAMKISNSESDSTLTLTNEAGQQRVRKISSKSKLTKDQKGVMRFIRFNTPSDVKGTSILLIEREGQEDDIWIFLPALKKVRRLAASNQKDSFVGTDFTFGDIVGHSPEEWIHKTIGEQKVNARSCINVESTAKTEDVKKNTGYSRKNSCIDTENYLALKTEIFDLEGKLLKTISLADIKLVDEKSKKYQAMKLEAVNAQSKHSTKIEFNDFKMNIEIPDTVFTPRYLEK